MTIDFSQKTNLKSLLPQTVFEAKVISFLVEWFSDYTTVPVQTSGSTGVPKVFDIEKARMISSARMTCDFLDLKTGDCALLCLPVEYISGKMMLVRSAERGLKLQVVTPSSTPFENVHEKIDFCAITPLQAENSLKQLHLIRNIIIGGAQVNENLKRKIHTELLSIGGNSTRIFETYGMSETLSHIALKQIYPESQEYFTAFENVEISTDESGCLRIFAPLIHPEILQTNDIVELKDSAQFKFLGRIDNVINSGGLKIQPEELESLAKNHLQNELVFAGVQDEKLGQKLVMIVECEKSNYLQAKIEEILKELKEKFSKNHQPREIIFLTEIPRLPNGKIDRRSINASL